MRSRMISCFSNGIVRYAVTAATVLGMMPSPSVAGLGPEHSFARSAGYKNIDAQSTGQKEDENNQGNPNAAVHAPGSKPYGLSYGEWSATWWHRILSIPTDENPNLDTTGEDCGEEQSGKVFFLAGTFGGPATRTCIVRTGVSVLIPILTTAFGAGLGDCLSPGWGNAGPCDVPTLRAAAAAEENNPRLLEISLDGVQVRDPAGFRAQSPVFSYTLTSDNVVAKLFGFAVPAGTYGPIVADGYWIMFTPLSPGVHTIQTKGIEANGFVVDLKYTLIVRGGRD